MAWCIFIDSINISCWPATTASPDRYVDRDDRALHRSVDPHLPHASDGSWRDGIRLLL